ncbi:hypothetical protein AMTRI_Chr01g109660 [Amborella trichopoda]
MERMIFSLILVSMLFSLSNLIAIKSHELEREEVLENACSYIVKIKTSCYLVSHTRDQISHVFGDAYKKKRKKLYIPRVDDLSSGTFEKCSIETFKLRGPCSYRICYLYLNRYGHDG